MGFSSLFGVGIGNTNENILGLSSHNFYIHILSEAGILIYLIFPVVVSILIYLSFKEIKQGMKNKIILNLTVFFFFILLNGFFTHNIINISVYYFFLALYITNIEIPRFKNGS